MPRNPVARSLASAKYRQRVINGAARRGWADLQEFELGGRDEQHRAELNLVYHQERLERLASYCAARTLRNGARQ